MPDSAPDRAKVSRAIDELQMDALDEHQQYLAALTVCAEMDRMGSTRNEVREVLAALDLLRVADGRRRSREEPVGEPGAGGRSILPQGPA